MFIHSNINRFRLLSQYIFKDAKYWQEHSTSETTGNIDTCLLYSKGITWSIDEYDGTGAQKLSLYMLLNKLGMIFSFLCECGDYPPW